MPASSGRPAGSAASDGVPAGSAPGRRRVRESLLASLVDAIVSGDLPEGSVLPNEAELADRFAVSRTVLREAMQVLGALGMARPRTRAGTLVLPSDNWNFLDPMVLDAALRFRADPPFYASLLEARSLLEPEAAALAAARASARQVGSIEAAFLRMVEANSRDTEAWSRADLDFHTAVIAASGNWIFRHFVSAIRAALLASFRLTSRHIPSHEHVIAMHREVLEAIRLRRPKEARSAMETIVRTAGADLAEVLRARRTDGADGGAGAERSRKPCRWF